ncbi:MAG: M14 family zinc carboxypeptidase [Blastocatellia bacterium]|nr:M14 family zinc carboxypeptidase [Blastocatellia bacterium]
MFRSTTRRARNAFAHLMLFAMAASLCVPPALAQGAKKTAPAAPQSMPQAIDKEYSDSIVKNTTDKMFLTELVDHLPASEKVPSPAKVLGYPVGTPNKLTYTKDQYRYYRELEKASSRVKVFTAPEKSELGREQLLVVVGEEASVANLAKYKEITAKLGDPRRINEEEAQRLIGEGKAIYWASGSIHSPETGSPEMLMELAYRLAVEESPFIQAIRKNVIVMITPTLEVDGRDMMVDLYNWRKANEGKRAPSLLYWGKYVAHDNNRDSMGMALALTRNQMSTFLDFHPTVLHDLHESVPFLYTSTGTGPYNAWLDPMVVNEWQMLAYHEIDEMTKRGVPGVWTHGFYDGWAPNYMFYVANGHNSIGRFYETFGNGGADTQDRVVGAQSNRDWFRPNPPLPRVKWSLRNNVNMQQSAILFAMNFVSNNKEKFLHNFYLKSKRSVAKARTEGPAAYVLPASDPRPNEAADLVNLLKMQGCEVHKTDREIETKEGKFPAGSYVVRMDQPYSRMADMLLDTQYYNVSDPRPYDDTGWTLGPLRNVKTVRIKDEKILDAPMTMLSGMARVTGRVEGAGKGGFVINHTAESALAQLRFRLQDVRIQAAEEGFKVGERAFNAGSYLIKNEGAIEARLKKEATELGLTALAVDELPKVAQHPLAVPRIALVHTWTNTQNEGWYRIEFDRLGIPYSYISDHVIRDTANLRDKYDVIIWGPVGGSSQSIMRGVPKRGETEPPIPWQKSDLTPNMGQSPDTTADMRGGMGLIGVANLQKFIESGGLFVTIGANASIPIDFGITEGVSIQESRALQARGSIYNAGFADRKSPIAYGYDEQLAVYFNQAPLLQVGGLEGLGRGGGGLAAMAGGGAGRPSGRGGLTDPDVPQGRAPVAAQPPRVGADGIPEEFRTMLAGQMPAPESRPRVILRFADEKNLLVSGMLAGGNELAGKAAVVDIPVGKGHVVMFANNPMWRHQTHGSFSLLFNAALNFDHLHVGRPASRRPGPPNAGQ